MSMIESVKEMQSVVFLMFVGTFGGVIRGNIQSCGLQKLVKENSMVNQLMLLVLIYTFITKKEMIPSKQIKSVLGIFLLFTILNKNHIITVGICTVLLLVSMVCRNLIDHYTKQSASNLFKNHKIEKDKLLKLLKTIKKHAETVSLLSMGIGFIMYLQKQVKDRGSEFNFIKFMFGAKKCTNL